MQQVRGRAPHAAGAATAARGPRGLREASAEGTPFAPHYGGGVAGQGEGLCECRGGLSPLSQARVRLNSQPALCHTTAHVLPCVPKLQHYCPVLCPALRPLPALPPALPPTLPPAQPCLVSVLLTPALPCPALPCFLSPPCPTLPCPAFSLHPALLCPASPSLPYPAFPHLPGPALPPLTCPALLSPPSPARPCSPPPPARAVFRQL